MAKGLVKDTEMLAIADKIRQRAGNTATYKPREMPNGIDAVYAKGLSDGSQGGVTINNQQLDIEPDRDNHVYTPSAPYTGFSPVNVAAIPGNLQDVSGVTAAAADVRNNKKYVDANGNLLRGSMPDVEIDFLRGIELNKHPVTTGADKDSAVKVEGIVEWGTGYISKGLSSRIITVTAAETDGKGTLDIVSNGEHDVIGYSAVNVEIPSDAKPEQDKSWDPTEAAHDVEPDAGYTLRKVSVGAISKTYVGSEITRRTASSLTASGATVTVPAGYYASQTTKSVANGTAGTPSASKTISGTTATVTPSVTNTTGYITGGTKTGTAITVTAAELDTLGTKQITANGSHDVVGFSAVEVDVPSSGGGIPTDIDAGDTPVAVTFAGESMSVGTSPVDTGISMQMKKSGTYRFKVMARNAHSSSTGTGSRRAAVQLFKDGTAAADEHLIPGNTITTCTDDIHCNAGDTIEVRACSANGTYPLAVFGLTACIKWETGF